jgi:hypothetical protein
MSIGVGRRGPIIYVLRKACNEISTVAAGSGHDLPNGRRHLPNSFRPRGQHFLLWDGRRAEKSSPSAARHLAVPWFMIAEGPAVQ